MSRPVYYVAAPLAPTEAQIRAVTGSLHPADRRTAIAGALSANLARASRWLSWLRRTFPESTFIAPWIAAVMSGEDDTDPRQREAGLVDADAVVQRCNAVVLCTDRISSGMHREHGASPGGSFDLTRLRSLEPPADRISIGDATAGRSFAETFAHLRVVPGRRWNLDGSPAEPMAVERVAIVASGSGPVTPCDLKFGAVGTVYVQDAGADAPLRVWRNGAEVATDEGGES